MAERLKTVTVSPEDVRFLRDKLVAVLGFGAQGRAHALNLRDSGCRVLVAQRAGGVRHQEAVAAGFAPVEVAEAARRADVLLFGLPDEAAPAIYQQEIEPALRAGQALVFLHGFNIYYRQIVPPAFVDVVLVAPKAQGRAVRNEYVAGRGIAALLAVQRDATGAAWQVARAWAAGLGCARAGVWETTFQDETETDLFGEQAVLCGGLTALIKAAFETLVEAGYAPELAYFECCHEVKLIADLIYEHGLTAMRERISNTARYGDLTRGPRVIGPESRAALREVLAEIRSGQFAREWLAESAAGRPRFHELTERDRRHPLENIGAAVRRFIWKDRGGGNP